MQLGCHGDSGQNVHRQLLSNSSTASPASALHVKGWIAMRLRSRYRCQFEHVRRHVPECWPCRSWLCLDMYLCTTWCTRPALSVELVMQSLLSACLVCSQTCFAALTCPCPAWYHFDHTQHSRHASALCRSLIAPVPNLSCFYLSLHTTHQPHGIILHSIMQGTDNSWTSRSLLCKLFQASESSHDFREAQEERASVQNP